MGKASSSKKVARAARAGGSPSAPRRQLAFPLSILAIVVVGAVLVVVARGANEEAAAESPRVGEHWHAAYGIYVCDTFLPAGADVGPDTTGLHTHNDGVAHLHPFVNGYAGRNATLGGFGEMIGLEFGSGSFSYLGTTYDDSYDCGGEPVEVSVTTWPADDPDAAGTVVTDDMGGVRFDEDRLAVTIAVAPVGAEIPRPPSVPELDQLSDVPGGGITSEVPEGLETPVEQAPGDTTEAPAAGEDPGTTVAP